MLKSKTIILFAFLFALFLFTSCEYCVECMYTGSGLEQDAHSFCFDNKADMDQFTEDYEAVGYTCHPD